LVHYDSFPTSVYQDAEAGTVTVENGTTFSADVVIGADGIRSNMRPFVVESDSPKPSGESGYRMLINAKDLPADHPLVVDGKVANNLHIVKGPNRKIVAYPIRGCELLNLVAYVREYCGLYIHPTTMSGSDHASHSQL
jgi:salicylate hydroxylase